MLCGDGKCKKKQCLKICGSCVTFASVNEVRDQLQSGVWRTVIGHAYSHLIEIYLRKLTHDKQTFRNDFVCIHYHLSKISA